MVRYTKTKRISLAVTMALMPWVANAASLGGMTVFSGLGEPLRAEIELAADKSELASLSARIAPLETYAEQGLSRPAALGNIHVELASRQDGTPVLKLTTPGPVNEPYLNMLLQVDWPTGRLLREYTTLLDPPGYGSRMTAAPVVAPAASLPSSAQTPSKKNTSESVTAQDAPRLKPATKAEPVPETDTYVVKQGDTLRSIARRMQPDDVSLEQMLVGLYRHNREAFAGDNMNRLIAGRIIRAPQREQLLALPQQEAVREIRVHASDWNAYRDALAGVVAESGPAEQEPAPQESGGTIASPAEDKSAPAAEGPRDVVKLSKAELPSQGAMPATAGGAADTKLQGLQEDSIAQDKAIDEVTERIQLLEKQILDMQQLLVVQNQLLAELQKGQPAAAEGAAPQQGAAPQAAAEQPPQPAPAAQPEEASVPDTLYEQPMVLGGAGALLLLLGGAWLYSRSRRRKGLDSFEQGILTGGAAKSDTVFAATGAGAAAAGTLLGGLSQQAAEGAIDTSDVDPISEAEVYMAYGRDAQAEEILKDAIAKEPRRYELHHKLLEIYAGRKDVAAFETLAGELYSTLGSDSPQWHKVADMGRVLDPSNPMYGGAGVPQPMAEPTAAAEDEALMEAEAPLPEARDDNSLDFDLGDMGAGEPVAEAVEAEAEAPALPSVEEFTLEGPRVEPEETPAQAEPGLDVELELPEPAQDESLMLDAADLGMEVEEMAPAVEAPMLPKAEEPQPQAEAESAALVEEPAVAEPPEAEAETAADAALPEMSFDLPELDMLEAELAAAGKAGSIESGTPPADTDALTQAEPGEAAELPGAEVAAEVQAQQPAARPDETETGEVEEIVIEQPAAGEQSTLGGGLDFNFELDAGEEQAGVPVAETKPQALPELDLSSISLDMDESTAAAASAPATAESPDVDTKLDLVTAYLDMGDMEGARELLQEVMNEGGPQQRERAQRMLDSMA